MLEVQDLTKSYGGSQALKGLTFSVSQGACFGLLGPNGAGKSTTMKIITGIVEADGGSVRILGKSIKKDGRQVREFVGYVPQNITLYEKLTARDNLAFFGKMYGLQSKELDSRMDEVLQQIGLSNRQREPVEKFSGGMKRRVNMAVAMLHRPKLLILDEPTVGIDPQSRNRIFELIKSLKEEGVTVVYSTHYMEEVEALCDDVAIVDHGDLIAHGSLTDVLARFGHSVVYVESPGFEALVHEVAGKSVSRQGAGWIIDCESPVNTMKGILDLAAARSVEISTMGIRRPSLESVFLSLTGTSLRDE